MARITHVKKAEKDQGKCRVCGAEIKAGDPYSWAKPKNQGKLCACAKCRLKPSMLTSSSHLANLFGAQEAIEAASTAEDMVSALEDAIAVAGDESSAYSESADNMEQYFPGGADEIREKAQACEEWQNELESARDDVESLQGEIEELEAEKSRLKDEEDTLRSKEERTEQEQNSLNEIEERISELEAEISDKDEEAIEKGNEAEGTLQI